MASGLGIDFTGSPRLGSLLLAHIARLTASRARWSTLVQSDSRPPSRAGISRVPFADYPRPPRPSRRCALVACGGERSANRLNPIMKRRGGLSGVLSSRGGHHR